MKKYLLIGVFSIGISFLVQAQTKAPKDRLEGIELSGQQKISVDSVRKEFNRKRSEIRNDGTLSAETKAEKIKVLKKEQADFVNALLSPEQRRQAKKNSKKHGA